MREWRGRQRHLWLSGHISKTSHSQVGKGRVRETDRQTEWGTERERERELIMIKIRRRQRATRERQQVSELHTLSCPWEGRARNGVSGTSSQSSAETWPAAHCVKGSQYISCFSPRHLPALHADCAACWTARALQCLQRYQLPVPNRPAAVPVSSTEEQVLANSG